jgi:hypothetical protein
MNTRCSIVNLTSIEMYTAYRISEKDWTINTNYCTRNIGYDTTSARLILQPESSTAITEKCLVCTVVLSGSLYDWTLCVICKNSSFPMPATCLAHLIILDFIPIIWFVEKNVILNSSFGKFLHPSVTSSYVSIIFTNTLNLCSSLFYKISL